MIVNTEPACVTLAVAPTPPIVLSELSAAVSAQQRKTKPLSHAQLEAVYIAETLAATGGNKAECARILGISRKNLYEKIARYKI